MVKAKKLSMLAAVASCAALLSGCEMLNQEQWEPQEPYAISISEDGRITEIVQETLDESYYSASELQNMITTEVADYNKKNGENCVTVKTFETEGQSVKLEMVYASAKDYAGFNNVEFYYGSLINAQLEGYLFDVSYKKVRDGVVTGSSVSGSEVIKEMDKEVMVVRAPLEVNVPGSILYTSTNAEILADNVVNATREQDEEEEEGLVLPSNTVYTSENEATFEEKEAANRVYIIFEMYD